MKLLLQCFHLRKIPEKFCLELNQLESLVYCHDYLNPFSKETNEKDTSSFAINQTILVNYFRNRIPSLHKEKRDEFLRNCGHPTIRNALSQLADEYKTITKESQTTLFFDDIDIKFSSSTQMMFNSRNRRNKNGIRSYNFIRSILDRLKLDQGAATKLFERHFNIVSKFQLNSKGKALPKQVSSIGNLGDYYSLHIEIEGFKETYQTDESDQRSILLELWGLCHGWQYLTASAFEKIDNLLSNILNPKMNDCEIIEPKINPSRPVGDQMVLICYVLFDIVDQLRSNKLMIDDRRLRNTRYINIISLMEAFIMLHARFEGILTFSGAATSFTQLPLLLKQHENERLVSILCQFTDRYFPRCVLADKSLNDLETSRESIDNWHNLLSLSLLRCSKQFVIRNMSKWFPIIHDKPRKWLIQCVDNLKKVDEYKADWQPNEENKSDDRKEEKYFNDEMIEKIAQLGFDWENETAELIIKYLIESTDQCFEFGIFLSKYVVFDQTTETNDKASHTKRFPQLYIDFMKKHCGITWELM